MFDFPAPSDSCLVRVVAPYSSVSKILDLGENRHPKAHNFPLLCALFGANFSLELTLGRHLDELDKLGPIGLLAGSIGEVTSRRHGWAC